MMACFSCSFGDCGRGFAFTHMYPFRAIMIPASIRRRENTSIFRRIPAMARPFEGGMRCPTIYTTAGVPYPPRSQAKAKAPPMVRPMNGAIDCDIHPAVPDTRVLLPHLDPYWREHVLRRGLERDNFEISSYPVNAPINARPDWRAPAGPPGSSLPALQQQLFDPFGLAFGICNVLHGAQMMF